MKKISKKLFVSTIIVLMLSLTFFISAYAENNSKLKEVEYSEAYKKWMELSEEEKSKTMEPMKYNIKFTDNSKTTNNIMKLNQKLKASLTSKFDLREVIPENVVVRNQMQTNSCWAFSSIGSLESSLAMKNYKNSLSKKVYDFSEMHMNYSTARNAFLNGMTNKKGINRNISDGGTYINALTYLTNGSGAIKETDMPFENTENNIDITKIQNKEVVTTLNDMNFYMEASEIKNTIKEYIKEYGGISAQIHGNSIISSDCYNDKTGAIYCHNTSDKDEHPANHGVLIIGWDDNYSIDKFNENSRPQNNGAWIIKNSWGKEIKQSYTLEKIKKSLFDAKKDEFISLGYTSASDIPQNIIDSQLDKFGLVKKEDGTYEYVVSIGDNGYMYVSYEDKNIYNFLCGIKDAEDTKDYDNIYQNDELGVSNTVTYTVDAERMYIANVFNRDNSKVEKIDKVSITTFEEYDNCKVYVNPNGSSRNKSELQEAKLIKGDNVTVNPGYITLKFEEPIELHSDKFAVVLEFDNSSEGKEITLESNKETEYENAIVNEGESFVGVLGTVEELDTALDVNGNVSLKAFTEKTNVENQTEEEQPEISEKSILSNFSNAIANIQYAKIDLSTDDIENSSVKATIKISNIIIGDEDAKYKYSHYISDTIGDKDIDKEYWNTIDNTLVKEEDGTYSLTIQLDSNNLKNYNKITNEDNLYIYLKEEATKGDIQEENINKLKIKMDVDPTVNIDGEEGSINDIINDDNNTQIENSRKNTVSTDTTIANKILPFTGYIPVIIVSFVVLLIIGIFTFIRYKKIDK